MQLEVTAVIVKGSVDERLMENAWGKKIIFLANISSHVLQAVGEAAQIPMCCYISECTKVLFIV